MAPNKKNISNIGQEAFGLLDEQLYATKGKNRSRAPPPPPSSSVVAVKTTNQNYFYYNQYLPQKSHVVQFKPTEERVMNSYEVVKVHGGVLICDYSKRKPKAMTYY
ncbi:hypothetical protein R3W88_015508 [Solanum pinnatisectum]|uniref:Uncharacterized protein n=1 Tax=Solanum pinnatisectum TaxID=50273 RepID=A0AAV9KXT6_9SOLN|nr:hypothetical protein R3W88_015508 [Solanum pinnatisectum]